MSQTKGKKGKSKSNSPTRTGNNGSKGDTIFDFDEGKIKMSIKTLIWIIGGCFVGGFFVGKYFEKIMYNIDNPLQETVQIKNTNRDANINNMIQETVTTTDSNVI